MSNETPRLQYRPYRPSDRAACIGLFRSNIPQYFHEEEQDEFEEFLDSGDVEYFVIEEQGEIVGCGGYGIRTGSDTADLCWGMVDARHHGRRLGEFLLLARLHEILAKADVRGVRLATSQHTDPFYERYGFAVRSRRPDGFAPGLDEVEMWMELTEENRLTIAAKWQHADQFSQQSGETP